MEQHGFADFLRRFTKHQQLDLQSLNGAIGVSQMGLLAAATDERPDPAFVQRLAGPLNIEPVDLLVIAGLPVPDEGQAFDQAARGWIPRLVGDFVHISARGRAELIQLARSLPCGQSWQAVTNNRRREQYDTGPGAKVVRMLENRNLDWVTSAKLVHHVSGMAIAASTIGALGRGEKRLTPELVAAFDRILNTPSGCIAALAGIPESVDSRWPDANGVAELIWQARFVDGDHLRRLAERAVSLRDQSPV
ncbi:hypothetical protein OHA09_23750 [Streptomyces longwoodensis]|uniref:hypothetical protein n=1 Tax=Streptomyces longwoodensis TaxID=68231 RepID=UPI002E8205DA|nr:hypothetical protein [Streptomyces longwoodensis]WUC59877.1 hypothetical protein OHA09_23750 [Streptomyces longwoodensis]